MTIKEAVIKYIEYRHSLGEKFKSAGILLVSFSKFIGGQIVGNSARSPLSRGCAWGSRRH